MSLQPLWPVWLILIIAAPLAGLTLWQLVRARGRRRWDWGRRSLIVLVLTAIALGPSTLDRLSDGLSSNVEVFFAVDRTGSMGALDYGDEQPRLDGVQADMHQLTGTFPSASFSIVAFDSTATSQLPLTTDERAVHSWTDTLTPEVSEQSAGSSVDRPLEELTQQLSRAEEQRPENVRLLIVLADGENTSGSDSNPEEVESFAPLADLIDGGAVLGYGTPEGGTMPKVTAEGISSEEWIIDPATDEPAISKIDEDELRTVATDLGVDYFHRIDDSSLEEIAEGVDLNQISADGRRDILNYEGFFWILALGLGGLLAWEGWEVMREIPKRSWMKNRSVPRARGEQPPGAAHRGSRVVAGKQS